MQKTINLIKEFRKEIGDTWPISGRLNCLRYCRQKVQKAVDIQMRISDFSHSARNTDYEREELCNRMGDVAMMYLSNCDSVPIPSQTMIEDASQLFEDDPGNYFDELSLLVSKLACGQPKGLHFGGLLLGYFENEANMLEVVSLRLARVACKRGNDSLVAKYYHKSTVHVTKK